MNQNNTKMEFINNQKKWKSMGKKFGTIMIWTYEILFHFFKTKINKFS